MLDKYTPMGYIIFVQGNTPWGYKEKGFHTGCRTLTGSHRNGIISVGNF